MKRLGLVVLIGVFSMCSTRPGQGAARRVDPNLNGSVYDSSGNKVAGASITAYAKPGNGYTLLDDSNSSGGYTVKTAPFDSYTVHFVHPVTRDYDDSGTCIRNPTATQTYDAQLINAPNAKEDRKLTLRRIRAIQNIIKSMAAQKEPHKLKIHALLGDRLASDLAAMAKFEPAVKKEIDAIRETKEWRRVKPKK